MSKEEYEIVSLLKKHGANNSISIKKAKLKNEFLKKGFSEKQFKTAFESLWYKGYLIESKRGQFELIL